MKYNVTLYLNGVKVVRTDVEAKNHKKAVQDLAGKTVSGFNWTHASVKGKTTKRYTRQFKLVKDAPRLFKTTLGPTHCILMMFGGIAELHRYHDPKERDKNYEEALCELQSAASAKAETEPTNIIVSSAETSDSKSGSTDPKTLSGSAANVTTPDLPTRTPIAKSSGKSKSAVSENDTWSPGSTASPSKPEPKTLWAKVKSLPKTHHSWPGVNKNMINMEGKTIRVKYYAGTKDAYKGAGWIWRPSWLDFDLENTFTVKNIKVGTTGSCGVEFVRNMKKYIGRTLTFKKRFMFNNVPYYYAQGWGFASEWLEPAENKKSYAELPQSGLTSEEIEKMQKEHLEKFKFIYGAWGKSIGSIDPSAV